MKTIYVFALMILCCLNCVNAQDTIRKIHLYRTWVSLNRKPFKMQGVLYQVKDSSILISNSLEKWDYVKNRYEVVQLHINDIEKIETRKHNSIGTGVLIGILSGIAAGGLVGLMSKDDPPCTLDNIFCGSLTAGAKGVLAAIPLAAIGAGIGAGIGSTKVEIPIKGSIDNYNRNKSQLGEYSLKKN